MNKVSNIQDIGSIIREYRIKNKITQEELALMANLSRKVIIDLEKGKSSIQFTVIEKILKVTDIRLWIEIS